MVSNGYNKGTLNQEALSAQTGHFEFRTPDNQPGSINDPAVELWRVDSASSDEVHVRSQYDYAIFHSQATEASGYTPNPDAYPHVVARARGRVLHGSAHVSVNSKTV